MVRSQPLTTKPLSETINKAGVICPTTTPFFHPHILHFDDGYPYVDMGGWELKMAVHDMEGLSDMHVEKYGDKTS